MHIRKFVPELHLDTLNTMLVQRKHPPTSLQDLPRIGFVIYEMDLPITFAFLRQCEGNYAQVDGLTSNPKCTSEQRHKALDLAITACIETAKVLNFAGLIAFTKNKSTLERSIRNGFQQLQEYSVVQYDLTPKV